MIKRLLAESSAKEFGPEKAIIGFTINLWSVIDETDKVMKKDATVLVRANSVDEFIKNLDDACEKIAKAPLGEEAEKTIRAKLTPLVNAFKKQELQKMKTSGKFHEESFLEGWNWAYDDDPKDIKRYVAKESKAMIKKFTGKDVKVIAYKQDPGYGYQNVYMVIFETGKTTGMCIANLKEKKFIEEPGDIEDYGMSLEKLQQKYKFQRV